MRLLIINADGYGFTAGVSRAIEECIEFGTIRSVSANVNFKPAEGLVDLVRKHPMLSVGCHINPIVGSPIMAPEKVPTLLDENGEFLYKSFSRRFLRGSISLAELRTEMMAQVKRTRDLVGKAFSHIDFHMGLHRLPGLYEIFLDVVEESGIGRIRTHRYLVGMESRFPRLRHFLHLGESPTRIPKLLWNLWLRKKALDRHLSMPDRRAEITYMGTRSNTITMKNYLMLLRNLPHGCNELVVHPGLIDDDLKRWSTCLDQRLLERQVLLNPEFRDALYFSDIHLAGYRDIPLSRY
jgi:predicted glycoside hydrolase/deacetylase ChbG (UPF0249 family)